MSETTQTGRGSRYNDGAKTDRRAWATAGLGLLGALAMTSCCILPLALVSVGVTGVFIGKLGYLYQFHWYFLAFASVALGFGFYRAYRPVSAENCADDTCAHPMNRTLMRSILWGATVIVAIATVFPYFATTLLNPF